MFNNLNMGKLAAKLNDPKASREITKLLAEIRALPGIDAKMNEIGRMKNPQAQIEAMQKIPGLAEKVQKLQRLMDQ
ncbi:hypothetical protein [Clostridium sp.]|uniref:hypothetical protein n=1 Tax=Clostridium sp. TaxID=1506 RepID=UPI0034640793